jgi:hypothetical protein
MTDTPVTTEALKAAARMAGTTSDFGSNEAYQGILDRVDYHSKNKELIALARMIQKHEPELIAESFDARTRREFGEIFGLVGRLGYNLGGCVEAYRNFIRQYQDEAK